ncbi:hypothetical protein M9194_13945 [Vibrio sp. S4M6]|uniref:hypothetical protein n=1 Tax=Vibrio sinus TaxID=2946865 RepID=UPI002029CC2C|nr:hypothetical protein [Vibrio sinus]MCL9782533.1 hypothetical protein [Vibrio sinus]
MKTNTLLTLSALSVLSLSGCSQFQASTNKTEPKVKVSVESAYLAPKGTTFEGPNLADNGREMVIRGTSSGEPAIFFSALKGDFWNHPAPVITTSSTIEGSDVQFVNFSKQITSNPSVNFNGPMVSGDHIVFSAELNNHQNGIFISTLENGKWVTKSILQTNQAVAGKKVVSLNAPYISDGDVYFIAKMNDGKSDSVNVVRYIINTGDMDTLQTSQTEGIGDFWDLSLNKDRFSVRAFNESTKQQNIYVYDHKNSFKPVYGKLSYPKGTDAFTLGGPSYYNYDGHQDYVANMVVFSKNKQLKDMAIFSNVLPKLSWVETGDSIVDESSKIEAVGNPTLSVSQHYASIAFQATTSQSPKVSGVYFSSVNRDKATNAGTETILPVVEPHTQIAQLGKVEQVMLGSVSLRHNTIATAVKLDSGEYGIVVSEVTRS